ncbi:MAG: amidohydrolase family protein [Proteobacteria bacterium]|nr:amidohydrolase family protein [Pseudomonadota bacterium]
MQKDVLKDLLNVVKGVAPPDCVIRNGRLINVFTNSIEENLAIVIKNGFIASIEEDTHRPSYPGIEVVDAEGLYLCPGFIDAHTHLDSIYPFYELVPYSIRGGTTTIISECGMVACACGIQGVESFVDSTKGYPLRCYFVAPPLTPPFPKMENALGLTLKQFARLLKREDFVGIGEAYWTRIVEGDERVLKQAALALSLNKRLDGHSAGARGKRLAEYIITGITSCHESVNVEEALEKLRFGVYIMIREGFVRKELKELSKLQNMDVDKRRIMMVSDVFDAVMFCEDGYLDSIVRRAIGYGIPPIEAIKMVTINPADYYGLRYLGAIAPLRHADILFLKDIQDISIEKVIVNGEMVFTDGDFTKAIKPHQYPEEMKHTIETERLEEDDFKVKAHKKSNVIRVIEIANQTITREIQYNAEVREGFIEKDLNHDIVPVAVIHRGKGKRLGKGFIKGTGIADGAFATTLIWDTANILTIGSSEEDMKVAVNRLIEIQGGTVISKRGEIIYEFPMPVYGVIPLMTMEEIRDKTKELDEKMKVIGTTLTKPFLTLQTIPFTGLPFLRITDRGLADIKNKKLVSLFL